MQAPKNSELSMSQERKGLLVRQTTLDDYDGEIEPLLDAHIADIEEEDLDVPVSEQELIVRCCDELLENALAAFERVVKPADDSSCEISPIDTKAILRDMQCKKAASILKISGYLDERLTRLRRSFQAYRYSTVTKMSAARKSISEYKKTYEIASRRCEEDRLAILLDDMERRYKQEIDDLSHRLKLARSSYETVSCRNQEMALEKMSMEEKCTKLENRALRSDDMVVKVGRGLVTIGVLGGACLCQY